jgi:acetyl-CoA C-acetyltransferase
MQPVYIVGAARSVLGRRGKGLAAVHPVDLLGLVQSATLERSAVSAKEIGQIVGGCVAQVGDQTFNIARMAWLSQGLPIEVAGTTVDAQCGSGQQATSLAAGLVASGQEEVVMSCGVESMSRVGIGANFVGGMPFPPSYMAHYAPGSQFDGAAMLAAKYGVTREDCDAIGVRSQELANKAWDAGHYDREVVPIEAPVVGDDGQAGEETQIISRDEGLRETTLEKLSTLTPVPGQKIHTAATASQISDGAAALILASEEGVKKLGVQPRGKIIATCLVGVDPEIMLEGPMPATRKVLDQTGLKLDDMDTIEINEAFAAIVVTWQRELAAPMQKVNPNGGAIAIGHPVGCTGARLIVSALHELERIQGRYGLITMCCGGGLGTASIIERIDPA